MASTYTVERQSHIDAPPTAVYERLVDFHRWETWSPWADIDPGMDTTYSGPDSGVGAVYEWSGNRKVGQGRMEIVEVQPDQQVVIDLRFDRPFKSQNVTRFVLSPAREGTDVTWTMEAPQTLMTKVMGLFMSMDKMIGKDFDKGLAQLRADVEAS